MAEFKCYVCNAPVKTGEKFTFTKSGSVHYDCFIADKRKELAGKKHEELRHLSMLLDSQLGYLIDVLNLKNETGNTNEVINAAYKNIEKECGETTRKISEL
jgi:hypothetical protein